jgi:hypothetical protein
MTKTPLQRYIIENSMLDNARRMDFDDSSELKNRTELLLSKRILRSLLTDVERLRPGTKGLERDLVTLEARLEHENISFLAVALCNLGKALDKGLSEGTFVCPVGFRRPSGSKLPCLFRGIFNDVFDSVTGDLVKGRDSTEDVKILRQLLFFLEKVRSCCELSCEATLKSIDYFQEM